MEGISPWSKFFKIIGGIITLGLMIGFYLGWEFLSNFVENNHLSTIAQKQLIVIKSGDLQTAYDEYSSTNYKQKVSFEQFKTAVAQIPAFGHNKESNFSSFATKNNAGDIHGILTSEGGSTLPIEYEFIKEDGVWKIYTIDFGDVLPSQLDTKIDTGYRSVGYF